MKPVEDFLNAIEKYNPIRILLLFSGGHDSLCSAHFTASILRQNGIDIPFEVYHGNTGTGIKETREYVEMICQLFEWPLVVRSPRKPYDYESLVKQHGFPGPHQHQIMYRNLKEKPLREYCTGLKSTKFAREHILLSTGIRSSESTIRMGYKESVTKEYSRIWTAPIMDWTDRDIKAYMTRHDLPKNPVKERICISGECLCGCFAKPEERAEIKHEYPESWEKLDRLSAYSKWPWGYGGKIRWEEFNPPGQMQLPFMPMCVGCEDKRRVADVN